MERHKIKEEKAFTILIPPPNEPTLSSATWPPSCVGPAAFAVPVDTLHVQQDSTTTSSLFIATLKTAAHAARVLVWCEAAIGGDHDLSGFAYPRDRSPCEGDSGKSEDERYGGRTS